MLRDRPCSLNNAASQTVAGGCVTDPPFSYFRFWRAASRTPHFLEDPCRKEARERMPRHGPPLEESMYPEAFLEAGVDMIGGPPRAREPSEDLRDHSLLRERLRIVLTFRLAARGAHSREGSS